MSQESNAAPENSAAVERPTQPIPLAAPKLSIGAFIGILHLLIGILGAGIISAFALYFLYQGGLQSSLREIEGMAYVTENALEGPLHAYQLGQVTVEEIDAILSHYMQARPEVRFSILGPDGTALLPDSSVCGEAQAGLAAPEVQEALRRAVGHDIRDCANGISTIFVAAAVDSPATGETEAAKTGGILVLSVPLSDMMAPTYSIMRWMGVIAFLIVAVTVFEGWLGSVYISRPLARLTKVAERLGRGDLTARANPTGPTEVIRLANTLNVMAGYVQNSLETMRAFVANASHELRTPLTSIKLQVGALTGGAYEDPEVAQRFLTQIDGEIDRLATMVNDMLDLTQVEGGGPPILLQPVDLLELAREVRAFWDPRSRQAGLRLQLITEDRPPRIQGDPYRLRQLLDNLLDNAVKHTPPGGHIDIAISRPMDGDRVRIEVRDTGVGIREDHLPHVFDRFFRVDRPADPARSSAQPLRQEGSGIGLAIARSIAIAHGGQIGVQSAPGIGSTFWVELPV